MDFMFGIPSFVHFGAGKAAKLGEIAAGFGARKAFVVYDQGVKAAGIVDALVAALGTAGVACVEYDGVLANPPDVQIEDAAATARRADVDIVEQEDLPGNAKVIGDHMLAALKPFEQRFRSVGNVRGKGLMLAIDLVQDKATREMLAPTSDLAWRLAAATRDAGAVVRPVGSKIVIAPPLVLDEARADVIVGALDAAFSQIDL